MEKTAIVKVLNLSRKEYFETHLAIINPLLPTQMTKSEIVVLAKFISLTGDIANDRFGTSARKIVMQDLGLSSGGLGNYLKAFKDKDLIYMKENTIEILPILFPKDNKIQEYMFRLIANEGY